MIRRLLSACLVVKMLQTHDFCSLQSNPLTMPELNSRHVEASSKGQSRLLENEVICGCKNPTLLLPDKIKSISYFALLKDWTIFYCHRWRMEDELQTMTVYLYH